MSFPSNKIIRIIKQVERKNDINFSIKKEALSVFGDILETFSSYILKLAAQIALQRHLEERQKQKTTRKLKRKFQIQHVDIISALHHLRLIKLIPKEKLQKNNIIKTSETENFKIQRVDFISALHHLRLIKLIPKEKFQKNNIIKFRSVLARAYICFLEKLRRVDIEKNLEEIVLGFLQPFSKQNIKHFQTPMDALHCCICISHAMRTAFSQILSEEGQLLEFRILEKFLLDRPETSPLMKILILRQLCYGALDYGDGTRAISQTLCQKILCLIRETNDNNVQLSAVVCIFCLAHSKPSEIAGLARSSIESLFKFNIQVETQRLAGGDINNPLTSLVGAGLGSAALLRCGIHSPLGIPTSLYQDTIEKVQVLLRDRDTSPPLGSRKNRKKKEEETIDTTTIKRVEIGWTLISSVLHPDNQETLDRVIHKVLKMIRDVLVVNKKPKDSSEMAIRFFATETAGSLSAAHNLCHCFFTEKVESELKDIIIPSLQNCVTFLSELKLPSKASAPTLRSLYLLELNIYNVFISLPTSFYSSLFEPLLQLLLSQICNGPSTTLTQTLLNDNDALLGPWSENEEENELCNLEKFTQDVTDDIGDDEDRLICMPHIIANAKTNSSPEALLQIPLPLPVELVNASITLFSLVFSAITDPLRERCIKVVGGQIKEKSHSMGINHVTCLLSALLRLVEDNPRYELPKNKLMLPQILQQFLSHPSPASRRTAAECFGLLARMGNETMTTQLVQLLANRLDTALSKADGDPEESSKNLLSKLSSHDTPSQSPELHTACGCCFSLGCIQRHCGAMSAGATLPITTKRLHSAITHKNPLLRTWALHSLALTVDAAGPLFQTLFRPTTEQVLRLLTSNTHPSTISSLRGIGALVNAIVGGIGPELRSTTSFFKHLREVSSGILQSHPHPLVRMEAVRFCSNLVLFAPQAVEVSKLVPFLRENFSSAFLPLRLNALICLRQLVQASFDIGKTELLRDLFSMLDNEHASPVRGEIMLCLSTLVEYLAVSHAVSLLDICKQFLVTRRIQKNDSVSIGVSRGEDERVEKEQTKDSEEEDEDEDDDTVASQSMLENHSKGNNAPVDDSTEISPRWQTKQFVLQCISRLLEVLHSNPLERQRHFHYSLSGDGQYRSHDDSIINKIGELLQMSFQAATSDLTALRTTGVGLMGDLVTYFSNSQDPELPPNHSVLEQYQAQFTSALRPAFSRGNSPLATAAACPVLVSFIIGNVCTDDVVLMKIMNLLLERIPNLRENTYTDYSEKAALIVQIALLSSLAQLFCATQKDSSLFKLLVPHIETLREYWFLFLKDYSVLSTQPERIQHQVTGTFVDFTCLPASIKERTSTAAIHVMRAMAGLVSSVPAFFIVLGLCLRFPSLDSLETLHHLLHDEILQRTTFSPTHLSEFVFFLRKQMDTAEGMPPENTRALLGALTKVIHRFLSCLPRDYFSGDEDKQLCFDIVDILLWPMRFFLIHQDNPSLLDIIETILDIFPTFLEALPQEVFAVFIPPVFSNMLMFLSDDRITSPLVAFFAKCLKSPQFSALPPSIFESLIDSLLIIIHATPPASSAMLVLFSLLLTTSHHFSHSVMNRIGTAFNHIIETPQHPLKQTILRLLSQLFTVKPDIVLPFLESLLLNLLKESDEILFGLALDCCECMLRTDRAMYYTVLVELLLKTPFKVFLRTRVMHVITSEMNEFKQFLTILPPEKRSFIEGEIKQQVLKQQQDSEASLAKQSRPSKISKQTKNPTLDFSKYTQD